MASNLIPAPDVASPSVKHLPLERRIELWAELVDESEALLLSGLREKVGPDGDWKAAYREWYARHMEQHERAHMEFLENLSRREEPDGQ